MVILIIRNEFLVNANEAAHFGLEHCVGKLEERFSVAIIELVHDVADISLHQFLTQPFALLPFASHASVAFSSVSLITRSVSHVSFAEFFGRTKAPAAVSVVGDFVFSLAQVSTVILANDNQLLFPPGSILGLHPLVLQLLLLNSLLHTSISVYKMLRGSWLLLLNVLHS